MYRPIPLKIKTHRQWKVALSLIALLSLKGEFAVAQNTTIRTSLFTAELPVSWLVEVNDGRLIASTSDLKPEDLPVSIRVEPIQSSQLPKVADRIAAFKQSTEARVRKASPKSITRPISLPWRVIPRGISQEHRTYINFIYDNDRSDRASGLEAKSKKYRVLLWSAVVGPKEVLAIQVTSHVSLEETERICDNFVNSIVWSNAPSKTGSQ